MEILSIHDGIALCKKRSVRRVEISISYRTDGLRIGTFDFLAAVNRSAFFTDLASWNKYFDDAPPMPVQGTGAGDFNEVTRSSRPKGSYLDVVRGFSQLLQSLEAAGIEAKVTGWDVQPALVWWESCSKQAASRPY